MNDMKRSHNYVDRGNTLGGTTQTCKKFKNTNTDKNMSVTHKKRRSDSSSTRWKQNLKYYLSLMLKIPAIFLKNKNINRVFNNFNLNFEQIF